MKTFIIILITTLMVSADHIVFDFQSEESSGKWYIVNDDVMGGRSDSQMVFNDDGTITFSGTLSPDNNGGFASIRSVIQIDDDTQFEGVSVRVKGDGNIYSIRFRTNRNFDGYAYQAKIQTGKNVWKEYKIPFTEFEPTFRGRTLSGMPELNSKDIAQFGMLIADYQFGEFTVDIDWVKLYK
ncbi:MAG: CIA30 family protein [Bacteroidetes bacterium]|nr:CIA30 family protein [Bacteroidota bacterium]